MKEIPSHRRKEGKSIHSQSHHMLLTISAGFKGVLRAKVAQLKIDFKERETITYFCKVTLGSKTCVKATSGSSLHFVEAL